MNILQFLFPFLFSNKEEGKSNKKQGKYSQNYGEDLTEYERKKFAKTKKCPDCEGELLGGPRGGMMINVTCEKCDAKFNISDYASRPGMFAERISDRTTPLPT